MGKKRPWHRCLGVLLILATAIPLSATHAGGFARRPTRILDQSLQPDGALVGQVLGHDGQPFAGLTVRLHDTDGRVTNTLTDTAGRFQFPMTHGGVFAVEAAGAFQYRRVWVFQTAPPAAHRGPLQIRVASDQPNVVRGQGGDPADGTWMTPYHGTWIAFGLLVGGIVLITNDSDDAS